jgi:hypothetical protein
MAGWRSDQQLQDHFGEHGHEMGFLTVEAYGAAAQTTLNSGTYFEYYHEEADEERIGCFDRVTGRFVVLNLNDEIVSFFATTERYIRRLPHNNYDG